MRLIHSLDLQIGKVFMFFEPEVAALLQDARQAAVRTLGDLAVNTGPRLCCSRAIFTTSSNFPTDLRSRSRDAAVSHGHLAPDAWQS